MTISRVGGTIGQAPRHVKPHSLRAFAPAWPFPPCSHGEHFVLYFKMLRIFIGPSHEVFVGSGFARSVSQLACPSGARREGRTPTLLREPDFESGASASSAIRAGSCSGKFPALVTRSPEAVNQRVALFSSRPIRCYNGGPSVEHRFSYDRDQEGREHG